MVAGGPLGLGASGERAGTEMGCGARQGHRKGGDGSLCSAGVSMEREKFFLPSALAGGRREGKPRDAIQRGVRRRLSPPG